MSKVVDDIRKVSQCVYMACDAPVAADVAMKCKAVADSHDRLVDALRDMASAVDALNYRFKAQGFQGSTNRAKALLAELEGDN